MIEMLVRPGVKHIAYTQAHTDIAFMGSEVRLCVLVVMGVAWGYAVYDLGPVIYQRPRLSDMLSTFLLAYVGRSLSLPSLSLKMALLEGL